MLQNRHRSLKTRNKSTEVLEAEEDEKINKSRALRLLRLHRKFSGKGNPVLCCFSQSSILLYENRLKNLEVAESVNRFRLKNKIILFLSL